MTLERSATAETKGALKVVTDVVDCITDHNGGGGDETLARRSMIPFFTGSGSLRLTVQVMHSTPISVVGPMCLSQSFPLFDANKQRWEVRAERHLLGGNEHPILMRLMRQAASVRQSTTDEDAMEKTVLKMVLDASVVASQLPANYARYVRWRLHLWIGEDIELLLGPYERFVQSSGGAEVDNAYSMITSLPLSKVGCRRRAAVSVRL